MGFSTLLDIIGSVIIGGIILVMMGRMRDNITEESHDGGIELQNQLSMTSVALSVEQDLKNIGYSADYMNPPVSTEPMITADTSEIKFYNDYDCDGDWDMIHYYLGAKTELASTPNPNDRYLYKKINNGSAIKLTAGITTFFFRYFNAEGDTLTRPVDPEEVHSFELSIAIEPGDTAMGQQKDISPFPPVYWRQVRLNAPNLKR